MKLTIVLTVYNKEAYLRRAFNALLSQKDVNGDDYEVLVVNDGSTDGSALIIDEYVKGDDRVRVLTQDNQGLSMARNKGVDAAKGEYVWFVDADDTISRKAVWLICGATHSGPDVIPIYAKTEGFERIRNMVDRNAKGGREILLGGKWEPCGVFNVFKRSFLLNNALCFIPGIYHEDDEFTPRALYFAQKVKVVPEILYTVYRDPNSITQVPRAKRAFDYLVVAESLTHFIEAKREKNTDIGKAIYTHAALCINNGLYVISQNSSKEQHSFNLAFSEKKDTLLVSLFAASQSKYRLEGALFKLFNDGYVGIYKLLKTINNAIRMKILVVL